MHTLHPPFRPPSDPLSGFSPDLRRVLEALATPMDLEADAVLFEQGERGEALYAVLEGAIEISVVSREGRRLMLDLMRPGAVFGEIALFDPGPRTATARALQPTRLLKLRNTEVMAAIRETPDLAVDLVHLAGRRMREMNAQYEDHVFLPLSTRLARRLLSLTDAAAGPAVRLSQAQLAQLVGATREAVSKTLGEWRRSGVIAASRGGLTILDPGALRVLARRDTP
jgi:CRP-like cAMP-binding protein